MEIIKDATVTKVPVKFQPGKVYFNPDLGYHYFAFHSSYTGYIFANLETGGSMCFPFPSLEDAEKRMNDDHMVEVPAKLHILA